MRARRDVSRSGRPTNRQPEVAPENETRESSLTTDGIEGDFNLHISTTSNSTDSSCSNFETSSSSDAVTDFVLNFICSANRHSSPRGVWRLGD
eukprot:Selendium_serpulae@DN944_c0_g1_i1.p1